LANAVCQAMQMSTDQTSSRASPLQHLLCVAVTDLSRQPLPSKQMDIKVCLSFSVLYPAQAFFKARIYQIYQQT
ncbi:hypothetical protein, partial [Pseudomonas sp. GM48]|uniref:hypothetical protein n=1 Tax=Pseudomonas sp. GM48 TaxID=1144330 RepID=UPI0005190031